MTALSGYVLEPLREDADFALYRGRQRDSDAMHLYEQAIQSAPRARLRTKRGAGA